MSVWRRTSSALTVQRRGEAGGIFDEESRPRFIEVGPVSRLAALPGGIRDCPSRPALRNTPGAGEARMGGF